MLTLIVAMAALAGNPDADRIQKTWQVLAALPPDIDEPHKTPLISTAPFPQGIPGLGSFLEAKVAGGAAPLERVWGVKAYPLGARLGKKFAPGTVGWLLEDREKPHCGLMVAFRPDGVMTLRYWSAPTFAPMHAQAEAALIRLLSSLYGLEVPPEVKATVGEPK